MEVTEIMKDIAIYGAGGLGREVACLLNKINETEGPMWNLIGFFDDGKEKGTAVSHFGELLGGLEELNKWKDALCVVLCFGNPAIIRTVRSRLINLSLVYPNIIDPDFSIGDPLTFSIGEGNIIKGGCGVTTEVRIGNYNLLNGSVRIGHDAVIGNYNVLMPGVRVSGEVSLGDNNLLGADSFVKQQLRVGSNVTLSPLSALLTKPKDGNTYIGNPAKLFKF